MIKKMLNIILLVAIFIFVGCDNSLKNEEKSAISQVRMECVVGIISSEAPYFKNQEIIVVDGEVLVVDREMLMYSLGRQRARFYYSFEPKLGMNCVYKIEGVK